MKKDTIGFFTKLGINGAIQAQENDGELVVSIAKKELGRIQAVDSNLLNIYGIELPVFIAEFSINAISTALQR